MLWYEPLQAAEPKRFGEVLCLIYLLITVIKSTFSGFFLSEKLFFSSGFETCHTFRKYGETNYA